MTSFHALFAATFTPMHDDGSLRLDVIPAVTDALIDRGVGGFYVCGSTGEGPSLTTDERKAVAEAYVRAAAGRVPVVVQIGHNVVAEGRALAAHAREIGADAVSALPPTYFHASDVQALVGFLETIVAPAGDLPFFYYHIPALSGVTVDVADLMDHASERLANLAGLKYTAPTVHEYTLLDRQRYTVLFGMDEMLLSGLVAGAHGAVGSTYNLLAPLANEILEDVASQRLRRAQDRQTRYSGIVRTLVDAGGLPAIKAAANLFGLPVGPPRQPLRALTSVEVSELEHRLRAEGVQEEFLRSPAQNEGPHATS